MVKDKVKELVEQMGRLNFVYDDWARANVRLDNEQLPAFLFLVPVAGELHLKNNNFRDAPHCLFAFLDRAEFDFDGEENESTIDRMKHEAKRFVAELQASGKFKTITEPIRYTLVYDELDPNLTGIVLEMQLEETMGDCVFDLMA